MIPDPLVFAKRWAEQLPSGFARQLASALREGAPALRLLREDAVLPASVTAATTALGLTAEGQGPFTAGALIARLDVAAEAPSVQPVWTGPEAAASNERLTLGVVADLIAEAEREILVVSYATAPGPAVREALVNAADRGVEITLLLERTVDNPAFGSHGEPFPGLRARRLCWPAKLRPAGASMHAKLLVVDRRTALVGSANLTGAALERNLEAGLLIRGGTLPGRLVDHLVTAPDLKPVA